MLVKTLSVFKSKCLLFGLGWCYLDQVIINKLQPVDFSIVTNERRQIVLFQVVKRK